MNFNDELEDKKLLDLSLTPEVRAYLRETAKWANFISIVGFVFVGIMMLISVFMLVFTGFASQEMVNFQVPFSSMLFSLIYFVFALITLIPLLYLYKFAKKMKTALRIDDQFSLTDSFKNLKSFYKFYGIYIAIIIGLYGTMFTIGILTSLARSIGM